MLNDARKFLRFGIFLNLEVKPSKNATEYLYGITRNFSYEGFSFVSQCFDFDPEETIDLRISHPQKDISIPVSGNVMWKKRVRDSYFAGIKIATMDKKAKNEILDYAHDRWSKEMENSRKVFLEKLMGERKKRKILVIDDDHDVCNLISHALEVKGFEVTRILEPEKAFEIAEKIEPELIFISLTLSGADGLNIIKSIRSIESLKTVPVFLMISDHEEFDKRHASFLGIRDIIEKPINADKFVFETLKNLSEDTFSSEKDGRIQTLSVEKDSGVLLNKENLGNAEETDTSKLLEIPDGKILDSSMETEGEELDSEVVEEKKEVFNETIKSSGKKLSLMFAIVIIFTALGIAAFLFNDTGKKFSGIFSKGTAKQTALVKKDTIRETVPADDKKIKKNISSEFNESEKKDADKLFSTESKTLNKTVYSVHMGVFLSEENAVFLADKLKQKGYDAFILKGLRTDQKTIHRVLVGRFDNHNGALEQSQIIRQKEGMESFIFHYETFP